MNREPQKPTVVMTYEYLPTTKPHGQTVGADGAGQFAVLFYGSPDAVAKAVRSHVEKLEISRIKNLCVVHNEDGYYGSVIETRVLE